MCGLAELETVLDLGMQALTGVFPRIGEPSPARGPLQLAKCTAENGCGLVQLRHSVAGAEMYGQNYGYRSGLNGTIVEHLRLIVDELSERVSIQPGDTVLDIGSNDGTLLSFYDRRTTRIGIDPTAAKFRSMYASDDVIVTDFFSSARYREVADGKARIITSIAMVYDLEQPRTFAEDIRDVLAPDGLWCFEQSYLPSMLDTNAYDTVCHEHLEYYGVLQIEWLLKRSGLKMVDVQKNGVNGGSFRVIAAHQGSAHDEAASVRALLDEERNERPSSISALRKFAARVEAHRLRLNSVLAGLTQAGKTVYGYGASTKGNVLLQYCGIGPDTLPFIAEVNEDKFGRVTPGTCIPIIPEDQARQQQPDVFLVLPWHFRDFICHKERGYLSRGGQLLFPLPEIDLVAYDRPPVTA